MSSNNNVSHDNINDNINDNNSNDNSSDNITDTNDTNNVNTTTDLNNIDNKDETLPMAFPISGNATYASIVRDEEVPQTLSGNTTNYPAQSSVTNIEYIPPVYTISESNENMERVGIREQMVVVYRYSKSVRCLTLIDLVIGAFHFFITPFGIINIIFPFIGYRGSINYKKNYVDVYLAYQLLYCSLNILILMNILFNSNAEIPENQSVEGLIMFQTINILFNFYFIKITKIFSLRLNTITNEEKQFLRHLEFENTGGIYY